MYVLMDEKIYRSHDMGIAIHNGFSSVIPYQDSILTAIGFMTD